MLRQQPQIDTRKHILECDLVPDLLPQILIRDQFVRIVSEGKEKWIVRYPQVHT